MFAAALTLGLLTTATAGAQDWEKLPDMPVEKWEPGTVVLDGRLYLFGGYTDGVRSSKLSNVFDPRDGSWTRIQDLPSAITHMNMVLDGRTVWFAGGFKDGYRGHTIAEVWSYDVDADRYTAAPLLPETRAAAAASPSSGAGCTTWGASRRIATPTRPTTGCSTSTRGCGAAPNGRGPRRCRCRAISSRA